MVCLLGIKENPNNPPIREASGVPSVPFLSLVSQKSRTQPRVLLEPDSLLAESLSSRFGIAGADSFQKNTEEAIN